MFWDYVDACVNIERELGRRFKKLFGRVFLTFGSSYVQKQFFENLKTTTKIFQKFFKNTSKCGNSLG